MIVPLKEVWVFSGPPSLVRILGLKTKSNIKKQIFYINFKRIFIIKRKLQTWNILATDYVKGNKIQKIGTNSLKNFFQFWLLNFRRRRRRRYTDSSTDRRIRSDTASHRPESQNPTSTVTSRSTFDIAFCASVWTGSSSPAPTTTTLTAASASLWPSASRPERKKISWKETMTNLVRHFPYNWWLCNFLSRTNLCKIGQQ